MSLLAIEYIAVIQKGIFLIEELQIRVICYNVPYTTRHFNLFFSCQCALISVTFGTNYILSPKKFEEIQCIVHILYDRPSFLPLS